mmetsp:Transcript_2512/g.3546  ORF Transcript_2512/g.3546 Transcript_2512/m.3546 type:complete len:95 (+) Transcript_2512:649-933(+)
MISTCQTFECSNLFINKHTVFDEIAPIYSHSHEMKAEVNIKPHGGETLQKKILNIIGFKYYPKQQSEHYKMLQLNKYDISEHRGSFLKDRTLNI